MAPRQGRQEVGREPAFVSMNPSNQSKFAETAIRVELGKAA
jgi:hypothetical protein